MGETALKVILAGDVMTGRGVDQILGRPSSPELYESWAQSALDYVDLAEQVNGHIPRRTNDDYVWGDALDELNRPDVSARVVNLETAVTTHRVPWPNKGINYRMHPENVGVLSAAHIDCCVLANNHVLDWCRPGLVETFETLRNAGIETVGAGADAGEAAKAVDIDTPGGRIVVLAVGSTDSGIPGDWAATESHPGAALVRTLGTDDVDSLATRLEAVVEPGDMVIVSIHWGPNWGYSIPDRHRMFAHALIDRAGVHVVHGHSSHHPMGIEVYHGGLILFGCGDLINDYEGIRGHDEYRPDLGCLYAVNWLAGEGLVGLTVIPFTRRRLRLEAASGEDRTWLQRRLTREGRSLGTSLESSEGAGLVLRW